TSSSLTCDKQASRPHRAPAAPPFEYVSDPKGYRFTYDRRWHIIREEPTLVVMRLVDRGELVAQCNVSPSDLSLTKAEGGGEAAGFPELSQFQTQVQEALGKLFGHFERDRQR